MKQLHRKDLYGWSLFDEQRNIDFHSVFWVRKQGNIAIDPLPLSAHDQAHVKSLGGVSIIIITNSDHIRDAQAISQAHDALIYGPAEEQDSFPFNCDRWLADNERVVPGLLSYQMNGSKTPGELVLLLEETTLITGDLVRCHIGGELCLLPHGKLTDTDKAAESVKQLAAISTIETVIPGDGWPIFHHGREALLKLTDSL
ncbi:MAG: MBL fold metallo-hydrolase [Methylococcales bacterium]